MNNQLSTEDEPMNKNEQNKKKKLEEKPEKLLDRHNDPEIGLFMCIH